MKVKCLKIYNESKGEFVESSPWLTINKEYVVLQILCCTDKGVSYRLIGDSDDESPGVFSAYQFEIINPKKASNWETNIKKMATLSLDQLVGVRTASGKNAMTVTLLP